MIRPRIILHHAKDHFLYHSLFLFIFTLTHFSLGFFSFQFFFYFFAFFYVCFFLWTFGFLVSLTFFSGLKLFATRLLKTGAFVILKVSLFWHLPSNMEGDPWSEFKKKIIRLKRVDYGIIFYISEGIIKDDRFSSQTYLPKLKSNSL